MLNPEPHFVELIYAGQNVAVTETATSFENERQKVEISLVKSIEKNERFGIGTNGEMKNISFGLFAAKAVSYTHLDVTKELRQSEFEGLDSYFKSEYNKVSDE